MMFHAIIKLKKVLRLVLKTLLLAISLPVCYLVVALITSAVPVNNDSFSSLNNHTVYLSSNGVHLDIIIEKTKLSSSLINGIEHDPSDRYFSYGWGDENFYLNTPTWGDLTVKNAFRALFLKSSTLIHVTRYKHKRSDWVAVKVTAQQLENLNQYIQQSFTLDPNGGKQLLPHKGYSNKDDFYKAIGSYSCFKTCNSWVNTGFSKSGITACLWTPFDFSLLNKHH